MAETGSVRSPPLQGGGTLDELLKNLRGFADANRSKMQVVTVMSVQHVDMLLAELDKQWTEILVLRAKQPKITHDEAVDDSSLGKTIAALIFELDPAIQKQIIDLYSRRVSEKFAKTRARCNETITAKPRRIYQDGDADRVDRIIRYQADQIESLTGLLAYAMDEENMVPRMSAACREHLRRGLDKLRMRNDG